MCVDNIFIIFPVNFAIKQKEVLWDSGPEFPLLPARHSAFRLFLYWLATCFVCYSKCQSIIISRNHYDVITIVLKHARKRIILLLSLFCILLHPASVVEVNSDKSTHRTSYFIVVMLYSFCCACNRFIRWTANLMYSSVWDRFCPSVFLYLSSVVPAIWLLELDKVDRRLRAREEAKNITAFSIDDLRGLDKIMGVSAHSTEVVKILLTFRWCYWMIFAGSPATSRSSDRHGNVGHRHRTVSHVNPHHRTLDAT